MSRRPLWFLLPGLLWLSIFMLLPLLYGIYISFTDFRIIGADPPVVTFEHYRALFADSLDHDELSQTLLIAGVSSIVSVVLGYFASRIFMVDLPLIRWLRPLFTTPLALAPAAAGVLGRLFFEPNYGGILIALDSPIGARVGIILVDIWRWTPMVCLIILILRRSRVRYPFSLSGLVISLFFLRLLEGLQLFDLPFTMTGGGPGRVTSTLAFAVYDVGFWSLDLGAGAAVSTFLLLVELAVIAVFLILARRMRIWSG